MCEGGCKRIKTKPSEYRKALKKLSKNKESIEKLLSYPDININILAKRCNLTIAKTKELMGIL